MNNNLGHVVHREVFASNQNIGTCRILNLAIEKMEQIQSRYFCFLDADDTLTPDSIQLRVEFLEKNNNCDLVFGKTMWCNSELIPTDKYGTIFDEVQSFLALDCSERFIYTCHHGFVFRLNSCLFKLSSFAGLRFDERYDIYQDDPMKLRIIRDNYNIDYIDVVVMNQRAGVGVSFSGNERLYVDCIRYIKYEFIPYAELLGVNWCCRQLRYTVLLYKLRFNKDVMDLKTLFILVLTNLDIVICKLIPFVMKYYSRKVINRIKTT